MSAKNMQGMFIILVLRDFHIPHENVLRSNL